MAKLITKFKFIKSGSKKGIGGYAKYIATREHVDEIDDSKKFDVSTKRQEQLITKILSDFPDSKNMLEYEDYVRNKTIGTASEFITRAIEENADKTMNVKTYADYIATRPRAERFGSHGLFTDDGVHIKLSEVSNELNSYTGNVWTVIISLRREDAYRLGFDSGKRWRDMLRTQTTAIAQNFKIPLEHLRWYAAFHNESHHPHAHMIVYSSVPAEGYLSKQGVHNLRSAIANDIFKQDLMHIYETKTEYRDKLRTKGSKDIKNAVTRINSGEYENPNVEQLLIKLAERLSRTSGKKVYGFLKADVKAIIDSIVDELSSDERIKELYGLWYKQKEMIGEIYNRQVPPRIPLSRNDEFKTIRNSVIQEALNLHIPQEYNEDDIEVFIPKRKPIKSKDNDVVSKDDAVAEAETSGSEQGEFEVYTPKPSAKNTYAAIGILRLFQHITNIIQNSIQGYPIPSGSKTDRKLLSKINEKKRSQGLKI